MILSTGQVLIAIEMAAHQNPIKRKRTDQVSSILSYDVFMREVRNVLNFYFMFQNQIFPFIFNDSST